MTNPDIEWMGWLRWLFAHLVLDFKSLLIWLIAMGALFIALEQI